MSKPYTVIVKSTAGSLDKYENIGFDTEAEADAFRDVVVSDFPNAFTTTYPVGDSHFWVVDAEAQTVTNDQAQADADALASSWDSLRTKRNSLLASSDWTQSSDSPLDDEAKTSWAEYRQLLRDLPATEADPANPSWPSAPE